MLIKTIRNTFDSGLFDPSGMSHVIFFQNNGRESSELAHLCSGHYNTAQTVIGADIYLVRRRDPETDVHDIPCTVNGRVEFKPVGKRLRERCIAY